QSGNNKKVTNLLCVELTQAQPGHSFLLTSSRQIKKLLFLLFLVPSISLFSQNVVINEQGVSTSTNPGTTVLDLSGSQLGFLLPSMANTTGITSPATALIIFNTTMNCYETYSVTNATWQPYWCFCIGPPSPAITFASNPVSICKGGSQTFSVSNANSINASSYLWTVQSTLTNPASTITSGQGTSSIVLPVTSTAGTYTITVSATNACGTTAVSTQTVTVISAGGNPTVAPTSNSPVCSGNTVTLFANATNSPNSYSWTPAAGLSCNTCANPTITGVTGSTTYSVTATNGCATSATGTVAVTVNATPTITSVTATPTVICAGSSSTLAVSPAASTYAWTPYTNLSSSTSSSVTANPTQTTTYSVTETTAAGCTSASSSVTLNVNSVPTSPTITTSYRDPCGGTKIAKGQIISYAITTSANCTYTWTPTGGTVSPTTGTPVNVTWTASGTESISVLATNTLTGCGGSSSYTLSVSVPATASCTYNNVGAATYVVPSGISTCTVTMYGGQGGNAYDAGVLDPIAGYGGAELYTTATVIAGTTLSLYVGGAGNNGTSNTVGGTGGTNGSGYGSGGSADQYTVPSTAYGSGGGGGASSEIWVGASRILVAGGGGGEGLTWDCGSDELYYEYGGPGGKTGTDGGTLNAGSQGGGATQAVAGTAGSAYVCFSGTAKAGQAGQANGIGGYGGYGVWGPSPFDYWGGGGGGGGYYGGGGASDGAGGGGSSFYTTVAGFTPAAPTYTSGVNQNTNSTPANGSIIITW
ncbi:MAG TPA: glycine-rich protein, partial [Bacteroidia bacterium]|nr:glycine-rich protein [Bacteroidia bacterium]